ncbi:DUF6248 family natural product biosynthesis protein [Streptomyces anulatus]|uniref:DUF6248 family natural product biosynthesis protein n=1 Tax=Streptomyces anulatus TaxID=1892 RepID=UPI003429C478
MNENESACREILPRQAYAQIARQAADLAVAAADTATDAACRSSSGSTARLDKTAHAAHNEALEAERFAGWAEEEADALPERVRANYAARAVDAAVRAQRTAGVEVTAAGLRKRLDRPLTPQEQAERESAARRDEAREEDEARAATGMDRDNREQSDANRIWAEMHVPEFGWTAGHVRVLEAAEGDRLYWRDGQARQAPQSGGRTGGRKISRERTKALYAARFLVAVRQGDGTRVLRLGPAGQVALELARLYPEGLHASDGAAYQARYAQAAKRWMTSDEKKAAGRRLPLLEPRALRPYRRPVTLAEQEARAEQEAADRWEDEGGYCPGVEPRPPVADAVDATATPAADPVPVRAVAPERQPLLRKLFGPRSAPRVPRGIREVIRRPQRTLTPEERETVRDTAALNFQGGLIMGIIDPVPNPSPMSEAEGEWVREQVWPEHFTLIDRKYPFGFYRWSMCERGTCWNCLARRCDLCVHRQEGGPHVDGNTDWVYDSRGVGVAELILRPDGSPCVWWCRCPCAKTGPAPAGPARGRRRKKEAAADEPGARPVTAGARADEPAAPDGAGQFTLF